MSNDPQKPAGKSFWARPEGTTGMIFGIPMAAGAVYLIISNMAWILALLSNTFTAILLLAAVGAVLYVLLDSKFRTLLFYTYRMIMRKLTGFIIELDPINIVKTYIEEMDKNRRRMEVEISNLKGQIKSIERVIDENKAGMNKSLASAKKAKEIGEEKLASLRVMRAGKMEESSLRLDDLKKKMENLYKILLRMYEITGIIIEDTKEDVDLKVKERSAILAGHSAFKSALRVVKGDPDQAALFDEAMEFMAEDVSRKLGEMETFMDMSTGFIKGIDLDNQVFEDKGLALLEKFERGESILLNYEQNKKGPAAPPQTDKKSGEYKDLI